MSDVRHRIREALSTFEPNELRTSTLSFLAAMGYSSDKTLPVPEASPEQFVRMLADAEPGCTFDRGKAEFEAWEAADLLFQFTQDDLVGQVGLFHTTGVEPSLMESYVFFAVRLAGEGYARGRLARIARQINRVFPMPVIGEILRVIERVLNPGAHGGTPPLYEGELDRALVLVKQLADVRDG